MSELCDRLYDGNGDFTAYYENVLAANIDARKADPEHPSVAYMHTGRQTRADGTTLDIELAVGKTIFRDPRYATGDIEVTVE